MGGGVRGAAGRRWKVSQARYPPLLITLPLSPPPPHTPAWQERMARLAGAQEAILYSYDLTTMPSILPAFANKRDLILVDEVRMRQQRGLGGGRDLILVDEVRRRQQRVWVCVCVEGGGRLWRERGGRGAEGLGWRCLCASSPPRTRRRPRTTHRPPPTRSPSLCNPPPTPLPPPPSGRELGDPEWVPPLSRSGAAVQAQRRG